mmetsp:Transcript_49218/g.118609  ORF Transcript_49218/g.118609 Transcript_49218/m.118609 type:complete len:326 (+) Transcript_49218:1140-2117(+)
MGLPLIWSERSVWFSLRPSASATAPCSPTRLLEMSRNCSVEFSESALPTTLAPCSPSPFHARLRRKRGLVLRPVAISITAAPRIEFQEKSACLSEPFTLPTSSPRQRPPASPMPLSLRSSLVSLELLSSDSARACAPLSPMLLPRSESSLIELLCSSASATAAQPRAARLLYERSRCVSTWFSLSALVICSRWPDSTSTFRPSWLSSMSSACMWLFSRRHSKIAIPPTEPTPRCLSDTTSRSIIDMNCCTGTTLNSWHLRMYVCTPVVFTNCGLNTPSSRSSSSDSGSDSSGSGVRMGRSPLLSSTRCAETIEFQKSPSAMTALA